MTTRSEIDFESCLTQVLIANNIVTECRASPLRSQGGSPASLPVLHYTGCPASRFLLAFYRYTTLIYTRNPSRRFISTGGTSYPGTFIPHCTPTIPVKFQKCSHKHTRTQTLFMHTTSPPNRTRHMPIHTAVPLTNPPNPSIQTDTSIPTAHPLPHPPCLKLSHLPCRYRNSSM